MKIVRVPVTFRSSAGVLVITTVLRGSLGLVAFLMTSLVEMPRLSTLVAIVCPDWVMGLANHGARQQTSLSQWAAYPGQLSYKSSLHVDTSLLTRLCPNAEQRTSSN